MNKTYKNFLDEYQNFIDNDPLIKCVEPIDYEHIYHCNLHVIKKSDGLYMSIPDYHQMKVPWTWPCEYKKENDIKQLSELFEAEVSTEFTILYFSDMKHYPVRTILAALHICKKHYEYMNYV